MQVSAIVVHKAGDIRVDDVELGNPLDSEATIAVHFGGVCGSDIHYWKHGRVGTSVLAEPMILGHEVSGEVLTPAADGSGPPAGTTVVVHPAQVCGTCDYCLAHRPNLCINLRYMGSAARLPHTPGGFAERLVVPTKRLVAIPACLDTHIACLAEPGAIGWHALDRIRASGHDAADATVAVIGAGPIGLLIVAMLSAFRPKEVIAVDIHERPLSVARQVGATRALNARSDEAAALQADIVIESSGTVPGLAQALNMVRTGGLIVNVGQLPPGALDVGLASMVTREVTLTGSSRFYLELPAVLDALASDPKKFGPVISHTLPLSAAGQAFTQAADARTSSKVLIDFTRK